MKLSEAKGVQELIDSLPYYALIIDGRHRLLMANNASQKDIYTGHFPDVLKKCFEHIDNPGLPHPDCPLDEAVETGLEVHKTVQEPDGSWVRLSIYPIDLTDDEGGRLYFHTLRDSTQMMKEGMELGLRGELLDAIGESIFLHNENGEILYANRAASSTRNYKDGEMLRLKVQDIDAADDAPDTSGRIERVLKEGQAVFDANHRRKDGSVFPVEVRARTIKVEDADCILSVVRDITDSKIAEEEINQERDRAQMYLDVAGVIMIALDKTGTVTMINRFGAALLGYRVKEVVGTNWFENYVPKRMRVVVEKTFQKIIAGNMKGVEEYQNPVVTKSGKELMISWRNTYIRRPDGQIELTMSAGEDITEIVLTQTQLNRSMERLQRVVDGIVVALAKTVEVKDPYTAGHQTRVALLATEIATEMNLGADVIHGINMAATIHDIGKIYVPAEILNKPGVLTDIEFEMIKMHPLTGYEILENVDFVNPVAQMVLQHHERLDGSGYPSAKKGKGISVGARILAVSDVVEAMQSNRPYRPGLGIAVALDEIVSKQGEKYDKEAVDACVTLFKSKRFSFLD